MSGLWGPPSVPTCGRCGAKFRIEPELRIHEDAEHFFSKECGHADELARLRARVEELEWHLRNLVILAHENGQPETTWQRTVAKARAALETGGKA